MHIVPAAPAGNKAESAESQATKLNTALQNLTFLIFQFAFYQEREEFGMFQRSGHAGNDRRAVPSLE